MLKQGKYYRLHFKEPRKNKAGELYSVEIGEFVRETNQEYILKIFDQEESFNKNEFSLIEDMEIENVLDGTTFIDSNGGEYYLDVYTEHGKTRVTVDYELKKKIGDLHPIGRNCVFNQLYGEFSLVQLQKDLREQHLQGLADYIANLK